MEDLLVFAKSVLLKESNAIQECFSCLDNTFLSVIKMVLECEGKILLTGVGKSGSIAAKIASTLSSTGTAAIFIHPTEANHGDLGIIDKKDLLIVLSNSGETKELFNIIEYANRFSIPLISFVSNVNSTLAKSSNKVVVLPNLEEACPNKIAPTTTTTAMLALGDALALSVCLERKFSLDDFKILHPGGSIGKKLLKVSDIMQTSKYQIPICSNKDDMRSVIEVISNRGQGCVAVVDDNQQLVGIITDGDLRRAYSENFFQKQPEEIMSKTPITISKDDLAVNALKCMNQRLISNLLVIDSGNKKVVGILHIHDCISYGLA